MKNVLKKKPLLRNMEQIVSPFLSIHPSFDQGIKILCSNTNSKNEPIEDQLQAINLIKWESLNSSQEEEITVLLIGIIKVIELYHESELEKIRELITGTLSTISFIITN